MALASRGRVLSVFKEIHRTCQSVFAGDADALAAGRLKINQEFKGKKDETDSQKIEECIQMARDSANLLRKTVVQAKISDDGTTCTLRITKDTHLENNVLFDPNADIPVRPQRRKKSVSNTATAMESHSSGHETTEKTV